MSNVAEETSDGKSAAAVVLKDKKTTRASTTRYLDAIAFATSKSMTFTPNEKVTAFRFRPSADMRYVEDAANQAQADAWLQTNSAKTSSASVDQGHRVAQADEWTEWQVFPEGVYLSNIWVCLDASGTGQTLILEAE